MKSLNFTRNFLEAITLADIAIVDGRRITQQAFEAIASNGLRGEINWPKAMPGLSPAAIVLWKKAITKSFINLNSSRHRQMNHGFHLRNWTDPVIQDRWQWWRSPLEDRLYKRNGDNWLSYEKCFGRRYYQSESVHSVSTASMVPVSIGILADSHQIESEVTSFIVCPASNLVSNFEDTSAWTSLLDGMDTDIEDPTILLDQYHLPLDSCLALMVSIVAGTANIVSDGSFNPESLVGPAGTSAVVLAPLTECPAKFYARGNNWVTGSGEDQSAYRSILAGVIATLTILDVLVRHHNRMDGAVTIALDSDSALIQSGGDWPPSVNQPSFDYLQVIRAWIKLSHLKFNFYYIKSHQTKHLRYNQLDWWGKRNKDVDQATKRFLHECTIGPPRKMGSYTPRIKVNQHHS